jgi:hypothetical protein
MSQWRQHLRTTHVLKSALSMQLCDIMKLLSIPRHTKFNKEHLTQLAILERAIECSFRLRKMIKAPLLTRFSPRIRYTCLEPTPVSALSHMLETADGLLQNNDVYVSEALGEPAQAAQGATKASLIDALHRAEGERTVNGEMLESDAIGSGNSGGLGSEGEDGGDDDGEDDAAGQV